MDEKTAHTFVICAYKESPYLEECIRSLRQQTTASRLCLVTSTPGEYLETICGHYDIAYRVRKGASNIADDWNFALSATDTPYVTIAHQDDIYEPSYAETVLTRAEEMRAAGQEPLILFTDYAERIDGRCYANRTNMKIKRLLLAPLMNQRRQDSRRRKRAALRFGNAICCPSVTYCMPVIRARLAAEGRDKLFQKQFRSNLDWQAWEWLSGQTGAFGYIRTPLMQHRIHEDSETSVTIRANERGREDYAMFCRFWPKWMARLLTGAYGESEKGNQV